MENNFNHYLKLTGEIGFVQKANSAILWADGLPGAKVGEVVWFERGGMGQVFALREGLAELISFSKTHAVIGEKVTRSNKFMEVAVGEELLGAAIDPLGRQFNLAKRPQSLPEKRLVDVEPGGIETRLTISRPCHTGTALVDLLVPIGKGQRELVIGDRKTGKSRFLLRAMLAQVKEGSVGVYAAVGKSQATVRQLEEAVENLKISKNIVIVASTANDPASLIYLTPYVAMAIAEYFRDQGRDVFLALDDLTLHAQAYRELSLLARRYPGRDSYPGDIFYVQSRLLERAGNFKSASGERSITCLPVIETIGGDFANYIPTNVMSMTDGHIFFDAKSFSEGRRPAIDPFLSVTRLGLQVQPRLNLQIFKEITIFLQKVQKLHNFASFGAELGEEIKKALGKEKQLLEFFDQTAYDYMPPQVQLFIFACIWGDVWGKRSLSDIKTLLIRKIFYNYEFVSEFREKINSVVAGSQSLDELIAKARETYYSLLEKETPHADQEINS